MNFPLLKRKATFIAYLYLKQSTQKFKKSAINSQPIFYRLCCTTKNSSNDVKCTVGTAVKRWREKFEKEGIPEPHESAEHIIAHVIGTKRIMDLVNLSERELNHQEVKAMESLCECRLSRMPVQYIIGEWDFRDITLKLEPPVFIPRPETELLVDYLLKRISMRHQEFYKVFEIGCGSGAISLSLLHSHPQVKLTAVDTNEHACELTIRNAKELGLDNRLTLCNATLSEDGIFLTSKQYSNENEINFANEKFDFIVSNPPYIPTPKVFKLQPEIKLFEDLRAIDGGTDGLKLIKPILKYASENLNTNGILFLEVDTNHPERIKYLTEKFYAKSLKFQHVYKDFCNNDRIVEISKLN